ncbi:preprotein translocase subunit YajC [Moraxella caviae]|uniref:Sec translocon accessory complex subunit YajC n=1 Tax=Moraxella caviae TaxID=34060 RepID=A0A1T0A350_9GAMM|nr:preprotein translocase subunit YajC [Moraxella caviae]
MELIIPAAHAASGASQPSLLGQLLIPVAFFAIFYFLIIRPQSKRNKQHKAMVDSLAAGNEVVFAGGLMGKIEKIDGDYAVIALNSTNKIKVQRASVISVLPAGTIDNI